MPTVIITPVDLQLKFACTAKDSCKRDFVCVNPQEMFIGIYTFTGICPYLIAWESTKHSVQPVEGLRALSRPTFAAKVAKE